MEEWIFLWFAFALVITGSGLVQSSLGFGYAVTALAVLPYFLDVRVSNLVVSLSIIAPLLFGTWTYRRGLHWPALLHCLGGAALGLPVGLLVFMNAEPDWLVRGTGLAVMLITLQTLFGRRESATATVSRLGSAVAGAASGFLSGAVGIGGPPVAAYAVRQSWSPGQFKAFVICFSLTLALLKAASLIAAGLIDTNIMLLSAAAVPFGYLGSWLGTLVSRRVDARRFRQAAMVMLVLVSAGMIVRGAGSKAREPVNGSVDARPVLPSAPTTEVSAPSQTGDALAARTQ